jgi:predicted nucleic acid-binding protein
MIVIADTSPLRYLVLVDRIDILPGLFGRIVVPMAVIQEMTHPRSPGPVRTWAASPPGWLEVMSPAEVFEVPGLGMGERQGISLAQEIEAEALLMDDRDAVREARRRGFPVLGTLAILDAAADRGLVTDLRQTLARLVESTNFRMNKTTEMIIEGMLRRDSDRTRD